MELIEKVNFEVAKKLNNLTLSQFEELMKISTTKRHDNYNNISEYTKLKNYTREIIKSNNNHKVIYNFVESKDFGRLQAKNPSLQRVFNGFRGILSDKLTFDLDMSNAHPNILLNLCKKHDIDTPNLEKYINNREDLLKDLSKDLKITRSEAKSLFLQSLNKEDFTTHYKKRTIKDKIFLEYDKETTKIINALFKFYKKNFFEYVKNETYNQKGKMINLLLCKYENEYLNIALDILKKNNIEICTLMFDGCMIYINENYNIENVINELNKKFKKLNITWMIKPHNNELLKPLLEMEIIEVDSFIGENFIEVVDHIINNLLVDRLFRSENEIFYIGEKQMYNNIETVKSLLYDLISKQDYNISSLSGEQMKTVNISKSHNTINNLVEAVIKKAHENNNLLKEIWENTRFKLFFNNGYYDFKENKFIKGNFNKTFIKINRDYNPIRNENIKKEIYQKILYPIFSIEDIEEDKTRIELLEFYLYRLSRIMAGHIEDKSFLVLQGARNCGKGILSDLLFRAFDKYIKITNIENFIYINKSSDAAKALSWLVPYEYCRLAISQEMPTDDKIKINGAMIKKFCSGGDHIEARTNNKDEKTFKLQSSLMVCCNDLLEIQPSDTKEFMENFDLNSKFIDKDFLEENKLPGIKYYEKDDSLKTEFLTNIEILDEFINIIISAYRNKKEYPQILKQEYKENDEDDDYTKMFNLFKITENINDFLSNEEIRQIITFSNIPFTICKVKRFLKAKGSKEGFNKLKTKRGLVGIQRITIDDDN